jgi:hypothetical protein
MKRIIFFFILCAGFFIACGPGNQENGPKNQHKDRVDTTDNNPHNDGQHREDKDKSG